MTVFLEISEPWQWLPGYFSKPFGTGRFRRVWWLCFAVAWVPMDLYQYNRRISSGLTEWTPAAS